MSVQYLQDGTMSLFERSMILLGGGGGGGGLGGWICADTGHGHLPFICLFTINKQTYNSKQGIILIYMIF